MTATACSELFIGWDVGAWNCDKNPISRDALVVLDSQRNLMGGLCRYGEFSSLSDCLAYEHDEVRPRFRRPCIGRFLTGHISSPIGFGSWRSRAAV